MIISEKKPQQKLVPEDGVVEVVDDSLVVVFVVAVLPAEVVEVVVEGVKFIPAPIPGNPMVL